MFKRIFLALAVFATWVFGAVNINNATKAELMALPNIGEARAAAIILHRTKSPFKSIDEVKNVSGIGEKIYENIKGDLSVSGKTDVSAIKSKPLNMRGEAKSAAKERAKKAKNELGEVANSTKKSVKNAATNATKSVKNATKSAKNAAESLQNIANETKAARKSRKNADNTTKK